MGLLIAGAMALVVFSGIRRLADLAGKIVPVMCIVYLAIALILIGANLSKLPGTIGLIFSSAFNPRSAMGGMMGAALTWGVRRGIYSNEAGQGTGTAPAAAVDADHPCDQGLVQALSVYIDTLVVCSISALCILCTNSYNVAGLDGGLLVENLPGVEDGIAYVQYAISSVLPFGEIIVAFLITTFAFTSLMSYYLEAEIHITYLAAKLPAAVQKVILNVMRLCFLFMVFISSSWPITRVWNVTDIGGGLAGCEEGLGLAWSGKDVSIVEMRDTLAPDAPFIHWKHLLKKLETSVHSYCGAKVVSIQDNGVQIVDKDGQDLLLEADTVLIATGMKANGERFDHWSTLVDDIMFVGDSRKAGKILDAMRTGYCAGACIS